MKRPIKILITIPNFDTAGSGKVVYDLVKGLDKNKFEIEICCFHDKGSFFKEIQSLNVKIHLFAFATPYKPFVTFPFRILKIYKFFKTHKFDIIHSWHWSSDVSEPLAAKMAGIPFVYTKKAMGWGNKSWRWRSQLSTKIITINKDMVTQFFSSMLHKISPIPLGVDTNYFKPEVPNKALIEKLNIKNTDFVIVSIANLAPVKGIEILLEAALKLNSDNIKVFIVGDKNNNYGKTLEAKYNTYEFIKFEGKKTDIRSYLSIADVFVIPTKNEGRKEGMPIAPLEAMASSKIVIGSNISGINDILNKKHNLLFESGNVDALVKSLKSIMDLNQEEKKQLQNQLRTIVETDYTIDAFIHNHEAFYQNLLKP